MNNRTLKQLLMSSNYFVLNKQIIKIFGIENGYLLTALIEASDMLADEEGWFYQTVENIEDITTLNKYKQLQGIKVLVEAGVLEQINKGVPCKRHFRINFEMIEEIVFGTVENLTTRCQKTGQLDGENLNTQLSKNLTTGCQKTGQLYINKKTINKKNKEININIPPIVPPRKETVVVPEIETERDRDINTVINYLNERVGSKINLKTDSVRKLINARLDEKYTVGDIIAVINAKTDEWINDDKMRKYLVPATLFRKSNFDKYIQALIIQMSIKTAEEKAIERWLNE